MVVKLKAYRLAQGYKEEFSLPIVNLLVKVTAADIVLYGARYSDAYINQADGDYGLLYRKIYSDPEVGGNGAYARIIGINYNDKYFYTTNWTSTPVQHTLRVSRYNPVSPIIASEDEIINITELILEDDVEIIRQIESLDKFDLRVSRATFSVHESNELKSFLDKYWNPDGYLQAEYMIGVEIEGYFWGLSDFDNINYDEIEKTYHFDAYDPIKWLQKNIWGQRIPSLGIGTANLENFLTKTCNLFFSMGKTINIDIEGNQNWNRDYVGGYYGAYNPYHYTLDEHLTITDMIIEILKHYGATIYYDSNGDLNFVTRNKTGSIEYNEDNMLEELNKSYQGHDYSGLLIIVQSSGTNWGYTGWALIWEQDGELQDIAINGSLSNIPKKFSYLDLRQELPDIAPIIYTLGDAGHMYRVFSPRTKEQVYSEYKELMRSSVLYETTLDGVDYQLYDTIYINDTKYTINYLQISFNAQNTKVRLYKSL